MIRLEIFLIQLCKDAYCFHIRLCHVFIKPKAVYLQNDGFQSVICHIIFNSNQGREARVFNKQGNSTAQSSQITYKDVRQAGD